MAVRFYSSHLPSTFRLITNILFLGPYYLHAFSRLIYFFLDLIPHQDKFIMPKGKAPRATKKARANQASTETTSTIASSSQAVVENNEEPSTSPVLAASNSPRYTSFDTPQFRHAPDPECRIRNTHRVGRFCHDCGGISMPWNENNQISHPIARRPDGTVIERSPPGSILDGLALTNAYEITAVSILLSVNEEALGAVPQLGELVRRDPNRKIVSDRISSKCPFNNHDFESLGFFVTFEIFHFLFFSLIK